MADATYHNNPIPTEVAVILQNQTLEEKEFMSFEKILEWYRAWEGRCYVSFSGGKDSTVLAYLVADALAEIGATCPLHLAFCDTGLEYPENREFIHYYANWLQERFPAIKVELHILKPEISFKQVVVRYGYPVISKEVAHLIKDARSCPGGKTYQRLFDNNNTSMIDWRKYAYLLDAPFKISHQCCDVMKKRPSKRFEKETGLHPIVGTMACESVARKQKWKREGCNAFEGKRPMSAPMSFWNEQDVLAFIRKYALPISAAYGEIVEEDGHLRTTGAERTGCMFCAFGATKDDRFCRLAHTHPTQYAWMMKPLEQGGLGMKTVLDYIGAQYEESDGDGH